MNILATDYNYKEFFLIVGIVFALALICFIVLLIHIKILNKRDKKQLTDQTFSQEESDNWFFAL